MNEACVEVEIRKYILEPLKPEYIILLCKHITDYELQALKDLMEITLAKLKHLIVNYKIYVYKFLEGIRLEILIQPVERVYVLKYQIDLNPEGTYTVLVES